MMAGLLESDPDTCSKAMGFASAQPILLAGRLRARCREDKLIGATKSLPE